MIITITGMPGAGKTYLAVKLIHDAWKADPDRKIFTNFPVVYKGKSTMKWDPAFTCENLQDSLVVVDEAYRDYNSRKSLKEGGLSEDDHLAFATNRHNENTFIFISQNLNRLDTVIREISEIWWVTKFAIPSPRHFFEFDRWRPIWVKVEMYDCLDSFKLKAMLGKGAAYRKKRHLFKKSIARMYDTHFFGESTEEPFISEKWFEEPGNEYRTKRRFTGTIRLLMSDISSRISNHSIRSNLNELKHYWISRIRIVPGNLLSMVLRKVFRDKSRPGRQRKREYDLFEPRGVVREIIFRNWMLWKPIFRKIGLQP